MPRLTLRLLGGFEVTVDGVTPLALPTRKAQALLAYLAATPGQSQQRDQLAALLWGGSPDEQARGSLRYTLGVLRKALGPVPEALVTGRYTAGLVPSVVDTDVAAFERLVAAGSGDDLARAADLYRGDFLAGLVVEGAGFEEWLVAERERLRELALEALARLCASHSATGRTEAAIHAAVRLLALDPLEESAHRTLMRLFADSGRRAAALRQYQTCVDVLHGELGAEPEPETRRLYLDLLRTPETPDPGPGGPRPMIDAAPLIGREAEIAALDEGVAGALAGRGAVLVVLGEAGVGKTRLVEALLAGHERRGVRPMIGRAYESEQVLAFAPWVVALRSAGPAAAVREFPPLVQAALARVLPELVAPDSGPDAGRGALGAGRGALGAGPENATRVFDACGQLFESLAARGPLLVVLEDFQWADEMSLRLLAFLGRRLRGPGLALVVTARAEEIADATLLRAVVEELERDGRAKRVALPPLSETETVSLVRALARDATAAVTSRVWETSAGNPLVVVETMRALREGGAPAGTTAIPVPDRVRQLIRRRVERLGDAARQVLTAGAVVGRDFGFPLVQRASGLGERDAAEALEELVRKGLLRDADERFAFVHDRFRETVYADTLPSRRQVLHAAVGGALEALHAGAIEGVYDQLAYHYARSADDAQAVRYLTRFADRAARSYAFADARSALTAAFARARKPAERNDITLRQARILSFLGRLDETLAVLRAQREAFERHADPRAASRYHVLVANTASLLGEATLATGSAERALAEAKLCDDAATMARAHFVLALESFWSGPFSAGIEHARRSIALLDDTPGWWLGLAHWVLGFNHTLRGEFAAARAAETRALEIGEAIGDVRLQSSATWTLGGVHALAGDAAAGIDACRRGLALSPDPLSTAIAQAWLGYATLEAGQVTDAVALLEQAVERFGRFRFRAHGWFMAWLAEAHLAAGRGGEAQELARRALDLALGAKQGYGVGLAQRVLARCAAAGGAYAVALEHAAEARATFESIEARFEVGRTALVGADLSRRAGAAAEAAASLEEARSTFTQLGATVYVARAESARAAHLA